MSTAGLIAVSLTLFKNQPYLKDEKELEKEKEWDCIRCSHFDQDTTDDVTCCNCCENGEFFTKRKG